MICLKKNTFLEITLRSSFLVYKFKLFSLEEKNYRFMKHTKVFWRKKQNQKIANCHIISLEIEIKLVERKKNNKKQSFYLLFYSTYATKTKWLNTLNSIIFKRPQWCRCLRSMLRWPGRWIKRGPARRPAHRRLGLDPHRCLHRLRDCDAYVRSDEMKCFWRGLQQKYEK